MTRLTDVLQETLHILGRKAYYPALATGGSDATLIDTTIGDRYDEEALTGGTIIITDTPDGAAPEGEIAEIESYSQSTNTVTIRAQELLAADGTFSTSAGWTVGTGWTIGSGAASHASGNTAALTAPSGAKRSVTYRVSFTMTTTSAGDGVEIFLGGTSAGAPVSGSATYTFYITPTDATGTLAFSPAGGGTWEGTIDGVSVQQTFSAAVEAGDEAMLVLPRYPLRDLRRAVNTALSSIGDIPLAYDGITTTTDTEYTVPLDFKRNRIIKIQIQGQTGDPNNNYWEEIPASWYYIVPAAPGTQTKIIFLSALTSGRTLRVWYWGPHPKVHEWNDPIAEILPKHLVALKTASTLIRWRGVSENTIQAANRIQNDLQLAEMQFRIEYPDTDPPTIWGDDL